MKLRLLIIFTEDGFGDLPFDIYCSTFLKTILSKFVQREMKTSEINKFLQEIQYLFNSKVVFLT